MSYDCCATRIVSVSNRTASCLGAQRSNGATTDRKSRVATRESRGESEKGTNNSRLTKEAKGKTERVDNGHGIMIIARLEDANAMLKWKKIYK